MADKPKAFKPDELNKMHAAFSKMSPDEQKALKGVTLKRVEGFSDPNRAAEFANLTAETAAALAESLRTGYASRQTRSSARNSRQRGRNWPPCGPTA